LDVPSRLYAIEQGGLTPDEQARQKEALANDIESLGERTKEQVANAQMAGPEIYEMIERRKANKEGTNTIDKRITPRITAEKAQADEALLEGKKMEGPAIQARLAEVRQQMTAAQSAGERVDLLLANRNLFPDLIQKIEHPKALSSIKDFNKVADDDVFIDRRGQRWIAAGGRPYKIDM
jgi:hypothetical protein